MLTQMAQLFFLAMLGFPLLVPGAAAGEIHLTILYDNVIAGEGMKADWGFACLMQGAEKTILFDTGAHPGILQKNVELLGVDLDRLAVVVISHLHGDHTGGLEWVLSRKKGIAVYLPAMAGDSLLARVRECGGRPLRVREPVEICPGVFSTGEMPADFDPSFTEQSLVVRTAQGLIVITGCSHPGIVNIVRRAPQVAPGKPRVVLGGFHLAKHSDGEVRAIIRELKGMGVERCGAGHCTGERAIVLFREAFADRFLNLGAGAKLVFPW